MFKLFLLGIVFSMSLFAQNVWFTNINESINVAKQHHVPIVVFVYRDGCQYCEKSIHGFSTKKLKNTLSNYSILPLAINSREFKKMDRLKLQANLYPSYFLLSENGEIVSKSINGYIEPDKLNEILERFILQYEINKYKKNN